MAVFDNGCVMENAHSGAALELITQVLLNAQEYCAAGHGCGHKQPAASDRVTPGSPFDSIVEIDRGIRKQRRQGAGQGRYFRVELAALRGNAERQGIGGKGLHESEAIAPCRLDVSSDFGRGTTQRTWSKRLDHF